MQHLEAIDRLDRLDGTSRKARLRQIPPETGKFLAVLAAMAPKPLWLEVGTSAGYSALWLSLACRATGSRLVTFEYDPDKVLQAQETFIEAGVGDVVELIAGDARAQLQRFDDIGFCFLDAEKELYLECYELIVPRLTTGGLIVADNVISHAEELQPFVDQALNDSRVDAVVVPIGKGELVCRRRDDQLHIDG